MTLLQTSSRLVLAWAVFCHCSNAQPATITPPLGLTYSGNYTIQSKDTIFTIAATTHRGVCDIARANRMADAELLRVGATLLIPSNAAAQDNDSCLLDTTTPTTPATLECIYGGPHVYTVIAGDTLAKIALKLNITVSALANSTGPGQNNSKLSPTTPLPEGRGMKIPQCSPSQCAVQPYRFVYGTYRDLAVAFNTTAGQIFAFNPTYSFSSTVDAGKAPVITMPINCGPLSASVSIIS